MNTNKSLTLLKAFYTFKERFSDELALSIG